MKSDRTALLHDVKKAIVHLDDDIVVVNKPSGLLTIQDRFRSDIPNLKGLLRKLLTDIFVVHRLDKDTTGILVFARHAEAHRNLSMQFQETKVTKKYHALVSGVFDKEELAIDIPLAHDPAKKGLMCPSAKGKASLTIVRCLEKFRVASLVECEPKTGRQHQIRVHLAAIGHPLFVDPDYGRMAEFKLSTIKRKFKLAKNTEEKPVLERVPLHSHSLRFVHPGSSEEVEYSAEYPKDLNATLQLLRKYSKVNVIADEFAEFLRF